MNDPIIAVFSEHVKIAVSDAVFRRCIRVCEEGTIDEIMSFVPFVLSLTKDAKYIINTGDPIDSATSISGFSAQQVREAIVESVRAVKRMEGRKCRL